MVIVLTQHFETIAGSITPVGLFKEKVVESGIDQGRSLAREIPNSNYRELGRYNGESNTEQNLQMDSSSKCRTHGYAHFPVSVLRGPLSGTLCLPFPEIPC